jgi:hypothetical protein
MTKKCFSVCRKQKVRDCNKTRRCRYNVGQERQFCRLDMAKYRLDKDCVTKTRITDKNRYDEAAKVIQRNLVILKNTKKNNKYKYDEAAKVIQKIFRTLKKKKLTKKKITREDVRKEVHEKIGYKYPLTKKEEEYYTDFFFFLKNL